MRAFFVLIVVSFGIAQVSASEIRGASDVLARIERAIDRSREAAGEEDADDPRRIFTRDLKAFKKVSDTLPPDQAAERWLALARRVLDLPPDTSGSWHHGLSGNFPETSLRGVVASVPAPDSWGVLQQLSDNLGAAKKRTFEAGGFRLFADLLNGDTQRFLAELERMEAEADGLKKAEAAPVLQYLQSLRFVAEQQGDPESLLRSFEDVLDRHAASDAGEITVTLPDLVVLGGAERARALIRKVIRLPRIRLEIKAGPETRLLAREVALEHVDEMQEPLWGLVNDIDAVELYEAFDRMAAREPGRTTALHSMVRVENTSWRSSYEARRAHSAARAYYLLGLVAAGRIDDAVAYAATLEKSDLTSYTFRTIHREALRRVGPDQMFEALMGMVSRNPSLPLWGTCVGLALNLHRGDDLIAVIEKVDRSAEWEDGQKIALNRYLIDIYLATDEIDRAVARIRRSAVLSGGGEESPESANEVAGLGLRLARLGQVLERPDWLEEGIDIARRAEERQQAAPGNRHGHYSVYGASRLVDFLVKAKRFDQAEDLAVGALLSLVRKQAAKEGFGFGQAEYANSLKMLGKIYHTAGRHDDVLELFEEAPWWGREDLVDLDDEMLLPAAAALRRAGREPEATRILKHRLESSPGDDEAYRLLVDMHGTALLPWLDEQVRRDRFEERPLIWKAKVLLSQNRAPDAEAVARQALGIDPTDGEQPAGQRVLGYEVVAEALAAQGKSEDAAFFRTVVESVRLAERGDEYAEAGLLRQSLDWYDKAEVAFADAYCVQWRLAEKLFAMGDAEGAEEHYEIAFTRMPEQFGRVASFCFGCEGAFDEPQSRSVAERVLLRLAGDEAVRPQVLYLLGLLREAQDRDREAYAYYLRAVQADAEYLDAWEKLAGLGESMFLPQPEREAILYRMLELDPLRRHFRAEFGEIADFKKLWRALEKARAFADEAPESLLPLRASHARLEEQRSALAPHGGSRGFHHYSHRARRGVPEPGQAIAGHRQVQNIINLIQWQKSSSRNPFWMF